MKIFAIGDMHLKSKTLNTLELARENLLELVKTTQPDYVVLLGDQLDGHDVLNLSCLHTLTLLLESLVAIAPVIMLVGNHDMINNRQYCDKEHAFTGIKHMKDLLVVDRPVVANYEKALRREEPALLCCPFLPKGRFCEAMDEHLPCEWANWRKMSGESVVFAHQEFRGVMMNQISSTSGDVYDPSWPRVVCGHVHEMQQIGGNIYYVGTPWETSFSGNDRKGVSILNFGVDGKADFSVTRHEIPGIPKRLMVECSPVQLANLKLESGTLYKIVVCGTKEELQEARKIVTERGKSSPAWSTAAMRYDLERRSVSDASSNETSVGHDRLASIRDNFSGRTMRRLREMIDSHDDRDVLLERLFDHIVN